MGKQKQLSSHENYILKEVGQQGNSQHLRSGLATTRKFKESAAGDSKVVIFSIIEKLFLAGEE